MSSEDKEVKPYQHLEKFATIRYSQFSEYNGQVFEGKKHGKGRLFNGVLDYYDGEWINDQLNGKGIRQMPNGDRYEGDFKNGMFNGNGQLFYSNKSWYKGEFVNDKKHGQGMETYPSGAVYTGQFENDKPSGKGVLVHGDYSYEGDFVNGLKDGNGKEFFRESNYVGNFWKGQKHGKGVWTHENGSYYKGDWQQGQKHGYGIEHKVMILDQHSKKKMEETYDGEFYDGCREGFGRLTHDETGNYFYGFWHRGVKNGQFLQYECATRQYFTHYYDFGQEVGEPKACSKPLPEQDGFRSLLEEVVIKGEKVHDTEFSTSEMLRDIHTVWNIEPETVEWPRISDIFEAHAIQLFTFEERENLQVSKYSNYQLMTVLYSLLNYPSQLLRMFSPQYNIDLGYYVLKFFISGEWKQVILDDIVPILKDKTPMCSTMGPKHNVGLYLIEKAWAKLTGGYFSCYTNPLSPEGIIEAITGLSPQHLSFNAADKNSSWEILTNEKNKAFARFVVPTEKFATDMNLPHGYFYTFLDYVPGETFDFVRLRSIDKAKVFEKRWNDISSWSKTQQVKMKIAGIEESDDEHVFWVKSSDLLENFEYALICPLQEGYRHLSFFRRGNFEQISSARHEMRFFEFEVPYKLPLTMIITQLLETQERFFPMRLILTKKTEGIQLEYVFGKGQCTLMSMHKTLVLDSGTYFLCVHLEYPKDMPLKKPLDLSVVLYTPTLIRLKPEVLNIPQFFNKAYSSCAKKHGEKSDLTKFPNGSDKLVFHELFKGEDGIFVQHFINNSEKIRWKYSANFTLVNMKIMGFPEHKQQIEIIVEPKKQYTLIIMQTGGKGYEFNGGQGAVNLEIIEKSAFKQA